MASPATLNLPIFDYSGLTSSDHQLRSDAIRELEKIFRDHGCFLLINHDVPESVMKEVVDKYVEFFELPLEEKQKYVAKDWWQPISFTSGAGKAQGYSYARDVLKTCVNPHFNCPSEPNGLSEAVKDYIKRTRIVFLEIIKGISESLGLEPNYIEKAISGDASATGLVGNLYPPCGEQDVALGIGAHTDACLLTVLIQNDVVGLQAKKLTGDDWFDINPVPNSIVVTTGDQLEILSNGRYKSLLHRAFANEKRTRISLAMAHHQPDDKSIGPAKELVDEGSDGSKAYGSLTFHEFVLQKVKGLASFN